MNKHILTQFFLCFILVGCRGNRTVAKENTPSAVVLQPTTVATITSPRVPPNATVIPITPTPEQPDLPLRTIEKRCNIEVDTPANEFMKRGTIILAKHPHPVGGPAGLLKLQPKEEFQTTDLPTYWGGGVVSKDSQWLAYYDSENLNVTSSKGTILSSFPYQDGWSGIFGWLDSSQIVIDHEKRTPVGVDLFDPFEKRILTLEPGFTDIHFFDIEVSGWRYWKLVYDPTLTRVSYMRDTDSGPRLVMVDIESGKTLWSIKSFSIGLNDPPNWSPDGKRLIVIVSNEAKDDYQRFQLFIVDRDGHGEMWVDIPRDITYDKSGAVWSPDGHYIAFYGRSLFVLDLVQRRLMDFCLLPNPDSPLLNNIIWSPDSSQLIYDRSHLPALIVDMGSGLATVLSEDDTISPLGWLEDVQ